MRRYDSSTATTRSALLGQIKDALKNRQHVEIYGKQIFTKKLLDSLIVFERGKAVIPPQHEEDLTIQVVQNIAFPPSDKINPEGVMRQVLQEFSWPFTRDLGHVQFYFGKLLKELYHDRIAPVFLFEHPEILKEKAFRILQIISEYSIDRKVVGIPSIMCISDSSDCQGSLNSTSFLIHLEGDLTRGEGRGLIEEACPGYSMAFDEHVLGSLLDLGSAAEIKAKAKELVTYMRKLGVSEIDYDLHEQFKWEKRANIKPHAKKTA